MTDHLSPAAPGARPLAERGSEVPDAVAPPPGHPRFPLFDSLRAIAAIAVLLVHVAIFSGSQDAWFWRLVAHLDIGVPFFFLLSGFLLYRPFLATRVLGSPETRTRVYFRRRFLRVAPAYWLALTVLTVFPGLYGAFSGNWWVYYGLLQNYPVFEPTGECAVNIFACGIAPAWSLAIEVAFYVTLPVFAFAVARLTARLPGRRWFAVEIAVLAFVSIVSVVIQGSDAGGDLYTWLFFSPLGRAWWFALGMGLAALSVRSHQRGTEPAAVRWIARNPAVPWAAAALLYLGAALFWLDPGPSIAGPVVGRAQYVGEYLLFGVIAALVVLPAVFGDGGSGGLPRRFLANRVIAWLGLISYGIFLWHYPIMLGLVEGGVNGWFPRFAFPVLATTTLGITIVCAALSYYLLERPLMRYK